MKSATITLTPISIIGSDEMPVRVQISTNENRREYSTEGLNKEFYVSTQKAFLLERHIRDSKLELREQGFRDITVEHGELK